jgi:hypothetical protein
MSKADNIWSNLETEMRKFRLEHKLTGVQMVRLFSNHLGEQLLINGFDCEWQDTEVNKEQRETIKYLGGVDEQ